MIETYIDTVIRKICNREGKYSNDPADPGGSTKYGITQKTLSAWRKKTVSAKDVEISTCLKRRQFIKRYTFKLPATFRSEMTHWRSN